MAAQELEPSNGDWTENRKLVLAELQRLTATSDATAGAVQRLELSLAAFRLADERAHAELKASIVAEIAAVSLMASESKQRIAGVVKGLWLVSGAVATAFAKWAFELVSK